ncbi:MAG: hypothetical protein REI12_14200 [Pedobacter sp.]|nr:hypothetical protein [Pedobacter sp.]
MTAMARHFDDLGPNFDLRWKRSSRAQKRELIAELRDLYIFLEEEDMPLLAGAPATSPAPVKTKAEGRSIPATPARKQGQLFSDADSDEAPAAHVEVAATARKDNPFLPKSILDKLQSSQSQASAGLRELMQASMGSSAPPSHEQVDLERELRLKLGPVVENLIEAQMELIKSELRVRLRAEMDRLIAEHVRKP